VQPWKPGTAPSHKPWTPATTTTGKPGTKKPDRGF
jgi:hypothetical protein